MNAMRKKKGPYLGVVKLTSIVTLDSFDFARKLCISIGMKGEE
jgi:hypothetical protein